MEFHDSWAVLALFIYVVGGLICWALACFGWENSPSKRSTLYSWVTGVSLFLVGVVVVNVIAWSSSYSGKQDRTATVSEVAGKFGLTSGSEYPLVLGSRIGGSKGEGSVSGGFFSISGSMSVQPATATSVNFQDGNASYILELPTSKITFVQDASHAPTVKLYLKNLDVHSSGLDGSDGTSVVYSYGECRVTVVNFWLNCVKPTTATTIRLNDVVQRRGLSPVVADNFDSATVTLTPEAYKQLLG